MKCLDSVAGVYAFEQIEVSEYSRGWPVLSVALNFSKMEVSFKEAHAFTDTRRYVCKLIEKDAKLYIQRRSGVESYLGKHISEVYLQWRDEQQFRQYLDQVLTS